MTSMMTGGLEIDLEGRDLQDLKDASRRQSHRHTLYGIDHDPRLRTGILYTGRNLQYTSGY